MTATSIQAIRAQRRPHHHQCAHAYYPPDFVDPTLFATRLANDLIGANVCHADATLIPDGQIISATNPTTPPKPQPGKCGN